MNIPINLQNWAHRHQVTDACLADLLQIMGVVPLPIAAHDPRDRTSEAYVQSLVRLEAPRFDVWLTRNNVGARKIIEEDGTSRFIRWGLANESEQQNKVLKSGDLIGWRSFVIEQRHVGARFAQFVSRECKKVDWTWSGDKHELAQLAWANLVTRAGGDARIINSVGSFALT